MSARSAAGAFRRSRDEAQRVELPHRVAHVLASADDGLGDFSILLARIGRGRLPMHIHPGEALYCASGSGRFWLEGISYTLEQGVAAFTPASLWHSFENAADVELVLLGVVCPGVVVGRYEERPPIFEPSGRLESVDHLHHRVDLIRMPQKAVVVPLVSDSALSPFVATRLLRLPATGSVVREPAGMLRAWVVVSGSGQVDGPSVIAGPLRPWDIAVMPDQEPVRLSASRELITIIEIDLWPTA